MPDMPDVKDELLELERLDRLTSTELDEELRARGITLGPLPIEPVGTFRANIAARPRLRNRRLVVSMLVVEAVVAALVAMHYLHVLP